MSQNKSPNKSHRRKGCGPKHLDQGEPGKAWGLDELDNYAQKRNQEIVDDELGLAPAYWRLGSALILARGKCKHGEWGKHLVELGIDKTRASKARAIRKTFSSVDQLDGLTVEEAYARRESERADGGGNAKYSLARFRKSLDRIAERTGGVLEDAVPMAPEDAENLLPAVRGAIEKLEELVQSLETPADESACGATLTNDYPGDAPAETA